MIWVFVQYKAITPSLNFSLHIIPLFRVCSKTNLHFRVPRRPHDKGREEVKRNERLKNISLVQGSKNPTSEGLDFYLPPVRRLW